jgi:hypothetical protein
LSIARDKIRIYLFYFFSYQPKLRDLVRIELFLVIRLG